MDSNTAEKLPDDHILARPPRRGRPRGTFGPNGAPIFTPQNRDKPWYDDIIDFFLMSPGASIKDCAAHLKRSDVYVRMLLQSDFMKARLLAARNTRREALNDVLVNAATKGVQKLTERIERPHGEISTGQLIEATSTLLDALGLNSKLAGQPVPQQTIVSVQIGASLLEKARTKMIEGRATELPPPARDLAPPGTVTRQLAAAE